MARKKEGGKLIPVLAVKGTAAWREWLQDFGNATGNRPSAAVVEEALREHAERLGFRPPPPREG